MLASVQKFAALRADVVQLVTSLRQEALRNQQRNHSDTGPLERGIGLGHADGLMLAADKLEALLAKYPA
jgi:hypothetical protein